MLLTVYTYKTIIYAKNEHSFHTLSTAMRATTNWMLSEDNRTPPRIGIAKFQPFSAIPGYVESANPIYLPPNEQYYLNVGVSDIQNDSGAQSHVGVKIEIGLDQSCNDTLNDTVWNFSDGWQDLKFNITRYAGQTVYIKAESYAVGWSSEWAALDYFYINNSKGNIVNPDPFLDDNGWKEVIQNLRGNVANPYIIMDFGGDETKIQSFVNCFNDSIDGIHVYNLIGMFNKNSSEASNIYGNASEVAHSYNMTFIATVVPGFNNTVASNYSSASINSVVGRGKTARHTILSGRLQTPLILMAMQSLHSTSGTKAQR
ncbi:MAG: hypothetical protein ABSB71_14020 [Candidatus Bathyarchaeia archaeon]|jgi:hypothetical protein